jgi:thioredoxin reductase (NADPH)
MAAPARSIIDTRGDQTFPTLDAGEIDRMRRFGELRRYAEGETIARAGEVSPGVCVVLAGAIEIVRHDEAGRPVPMVTHLPGAFMGELAQLSGRPALTDAFARKPAEVLVIPPERLRALLVAEAELGERIMRALILRRVALLETGAGGRSSSAARPMATCCGSKDSCGATAIRTCASIRTSTPRRRR